MKSPINVCMAKRRNDFSLSSTAVMGAVLTLSVLVTGCLGARQTTMDEITGSVTYNEAFLDYPGPSEQWAGSAHFVVHVSAKDNDVDVKIPAQWLNIHSSAPNVVGPSQQVPPTLLEHRAPASKLSGEEVREKLGALASAMAEDSGAASYHGCLYPIRVRLIRADGNVLDKAGCRDQSRWSKTASDTVDYFFSHH